MPTATIGDGSHSPVVAPSTPPTVLVASIPVPSPSVGPAPSVMVIPAVLPIRLRVLSSLAVATVATVALGCAVSLSANERALVARSAPEVQRAADRIIESVAGARIIGLGEPTHGEGMTQRLRNAVMEQAITELGCTTVVIEGRFSDRVRDDAWVHGRGAEPDDSGADHLRGTGTLGTEQWAACFDGLRDHGRENGRDDSSLRITGTDPCLTIPSCVYSLASMVEPYSKPEAERLRAWAERDDDASRTAVTEWTIPAVVPGDEHATMARLQALAEEGAMMDAERSIWDQRERIMADNVQWAERRSAGCVVVLAHAGHTDMQGVSRPDRPWWERVEPMGRYLRERYGDDYRAVHFTLGRGRFTAHRTLVGFIRPAQLRRPPPMRAFALTDVVAGSVELRVADRPGITVLETHELGDAARRPMYMRNIPFIWNGIGKLAEADWAQRTPEEAFDVLVYTPHGVPMVPL